MNVVYHATCTFIRSYHCYFNMCYPGSGVVLDCIVPDLCRLSYFDYLFMLTLHLMNDISTDDESTKKLIIPSYLLVSRVDLFGKLIDRIPGSRLLISSLLGSALRMHVEYSLRPDPPWSNLRGNHSYQP